MLTVSTVNGDGLRAAAGKGCLAWLAATDADVVCVRETRATVDQLPDAVRSPSGWHATFAASADKVHAPVSVRYRS